MLGGAVGESQGGPPGIAHLSGASVVVERFPIGDSPPEGAVDVDPAKGVRPTETLTAPAFSATYTTILLMTPPGTVGTPTVVPDEVVFPEKEQILFSRTLVLESVASTKILG